jgi:hypothetical protein
MRSAFGGTTTSASGWMRPKPARGGFVVEWPVYLSRRSLKLSRKAEFGASSHCKISISNVSKIAADRPLSKMRQCANDPKPPERSSETGHRNRLKLSFKTPQRGLQPS